MCVFILKTRTDLVDWKWWRNESIKDRTSGRRWWSVQTASVLSVQLHEKVCLFSSRIGVTCEPDVDYIIFYDLCVIHVIFMQTAASFLL